MATLQEFREMHKVSRYWLRRHHFHNELPSSTDPTQDIPIKNIQLAANGLPLNVRNIPQFYSNAPVENLTSIDRRNNDKFDVASELQATERHAQNIVKSIKQNVKDEK